MAPIGSYPILVGPVTLEPTVEEFPWTNLKYGSVYRIQWHLFWVASPSITVKTIAFTVSHKKYKGWNFRFRRIRVFSLEPYEWAACFRPFSGSGLLCYSYASAGSSFLLQWTTHFRSSVEPITDINIINKMADVIKDWYGTPSCASTHEPSASTIPKWRQCEHFRREQH